MNRNVMVSHQKACVKSAQQLPTTSMGQPVLGAVGGSNTNTVFISDAGRNNKRPLFKVVLNSEEIKSLIDAKDQEIKKQEAAVKQVVENQQQTQKTNNAKKLRLSTSESQSPVVVVSEATTTTLNVNPTITGNNDEDMDDDEDDDITEVDIQQAPSETNENGIPKEIDGSISVGGIKPVVRKRAPIFPFEAADHYVPDNNSNNVINKYAINPPPSEAENRQGFCLRQFKGILF